MPLINKRQIFCQTKMQADILERCQSTPDSIAFSMASPICVVEFFPPRSGVATLPVRRISTTADSILRAAIGHDFDQQLIGTGSGGRHFLNSNIFVVIPFSDFHCIIHFNILNYMSHAKKNSITFPPKRLL